MYMNEADSFDCAIDRLGSFFRLNNKVIETQSWQSIKIPQGIAFKEVDNVFLVVNLQDQFEHGYWANDIKPNLPWADMAFEERVEGTPWNPGTAWEKWPYARSAANFKQDRFSHSYAERYWPKEANFLSDSQHSHYVDYQGDIRSGIRFKYGDLDDVVNLLIKDKLTRQAYLPVWFPEDTGVVHGSRVPCTLGYHFLIRDNRISITYYIRSCDWVRHFKDDLYMTMRLLLWVRNRMPEPLSLGTFTFHCSSLHCFTTDKI